MKYEQEILSILNKKDDFTTSDAITSVLNISKKTLSNVINAINSNEKIIISTNKGYKLIHKPEKSAQEVDSPDQREEYIIWSLLTKKNIMIYDLANELNVSYSTIRKNISNLKKILKNDFDLDIISIKEMLNISGNEENIRKLFDWRIRSETKNNFTTISFLQNKFPEIDILQLRIIVQSVLQKQQIFVNDFQLISIILHLCIILQRTFNNSIIMSTRYQFSNEIEYTAAKKILDKVSLLYPQCSFNEFEINSFALLLASNTTKLNSSINIDDIVNKKIIQLTDSIIQNVRNDFNIDLSSSSFRNKFMIHLDNLIDRLKYNTESKNDLVLITKSQFPLIYDVATSIAFTIKKEYGYNILDDEISYIAFHIGNEIDEQIQNETLIKCAVIAPDYQQMNYHLANKLITLFPSKIIIILIKNISLGQYEFDDIDLVISTINIETDLPSIVVHPFLSADDIERIDRKLLILSNRKKNRKFRKELLHIFKPEFYVKDKYFSSEKQAIHYMCNQLKNNGYVTDTFEKLVIDREQLSSTAFGNYAIPHPMELSAIETTIFVLVNNEEFPWGDYNVNFVFLIAINVNEKDLFRDFFASICDIMSNDKIKQKLLKANNFDEFIKTIQTYI